MSTIREILEEYGVEYSTAGAKNVSRGWIGVQCPFCDDTSNHLGIRLSDSVCKCWKCGPHRIVSAISELTGITYREAKEIAKNLGEEDDQPPLQKTSSVFAKRCSLPPESTSIFPDIHKDYLRSRGFPPLRTIRKYKLRACHTVGRYMFRIIIPIFMNGRLVSFTARDITGQQDPPYKHSPIHQSVIDPKNSIYQYDTLAPGKDAILVEGPLDAWKLGDGAVCLFGVEYTEKQIVALKKKQIRNLYIILDPDLAGIRASKRLAPTMVPLVSGNVEIVTLQGVGDPGELTAAEANEIKIGLGFNIL